MGFLDDFDSLFEEGNTHRDEATVDPIEEPVALAPEVQPKQSSFLSDFDALFVDEDKQVEPAETSGTNQFTEGVTGSWDTEPTKEPAQEPAEDTYDLDYSGSEVQKTVYNEELAATARDLITTPVRAMQNAGATVGRLGVWGIDRLGTLFGSSSIKESADRWDAMFKEGIARRTPEVVNESIWDNPENLANPVVLAHHIATVPAQVVASGGNPFVYAAMNGLPAGADAFDEAMVETNGNVKVAATTATLTSVLNMAGEVVGLKILKATGADKALGGAVKGKLLRKLFERTSARSAAAVVGEGGSEAATSLADNIQKDVLTDIGSGKDLVTVVNNLATALPDHLKAAFDEGVVGGISAKPTQSVMRVQQKLVSGDLGDLTTQEVLDNATEVVDAVAGKSETAEITEIFDKDIEEAATETFEFGDKRMLDGDIEEARATARSEFFEAMKVSQEAEVATPDKVEAPQRTKEEIEADRDAAYSRFKGQQLAKDRSPAIELPEGPLPTPQDSIQLPGPVTRQEPITTQRQLPAPQERPALPPGTAAPTKQLSAPQERPALPGTEIPTKKLSAPQERTALPPGTEIPTKQLSAPQERTALPPGTEVPTKQLPAPQETETLDTAVPRKFIQEGERGFSQDGQVVRTTLSPEQVLEREQEQALEAQKEVENAPLEREDIKVEGPVNELKAAIIYGEAGKAKDILESQFRIRDRGRALNAIEAEFKNLNLLDEETAAKINEIRDTQVVKTTPKDTGDYQIVQVKKDDPGYTTTREKWRVLDKDGKVINFPDQKPGGNTRKDALGYAQALQSGEGATYTKGATAVKQVSAAAGTKEYAAQGKQEKKTPVVPEYEQSGKVKVYSKDTPEFKRLAEKYGDAAIKPRPPKELGSLDIKRTDKLVKDIEGDLKDAMEVDDVVKGRVSTTEFLLSNKDSDVKESAKVLSEVIGTDLFTDSLNGITFDPNKKGGSYNPETQRTVVGTKDSTPAEVGATILHEINHKVFVDKLDTDDGRKLHPKLQTIRHELELSFLKSENLKEAYKEAKKRGSAQYFAAYVKENRESIPESDTALHALYASLNDAELLAVTVERADVRAVLAGMKSPGKERHKALKFIENIIGKFFNFKANKAGEYDSLSYLYGAMRVLSTTDMSSYKVPAKDQQRVYDKLDFDQITKELDAEAEELKTFGGRVKHLKNTTGKRGNKTKKLVKDFYEGAVVSLDNLMYRVDKKYQGALRDFESRVAVKGKERLNKIDNMADAVREMEPADRRLFDITIRNYNRSEARTKLNQLFIRYPKAKSAFNNEIRPMLKELEQELQDFGLIGKGRKYYFPNSINDMSGLMAYLEETKGKQNFVEELKNVLGDNVSDAEMQSAISNIVTRGEIPAMYRKPGSSKARTIWEVNKEMSEFYEDPLVVLQNHVRVNTDAIEQRRLIGKSGIGKLEKELNTLKEKEAKTEEEKALIESYEQRLSNTAVELDFGLNKWMADEARDGNLNPDQQQILLRGFRARFTQRPLGELGGMIRDLGTLSVLGQFTSTLLQVTDAFHMAKNAGIHNTVKALMTRQRLYTKDDLDIHGFLRDFGPDSKLSRGVDKLLHFTGFAQFDAAIKTTAMQASLEKVKKMTLEDFKEEYGHIYDRRGETADVYRRIKKGEKHPQVARFAFNELQRVYPMTTSQMPLYYVGGGSKRLLYTLKSYTLKTYNNLQQDIKETYDADIKAGKSKKVAAMNASKSVLSYAMLLVAAGASVDCVNNAVLGRGCDFSEEVVDNTLKLIFLSRYSGGGVMKGDISNVLGDILMPASNWAELPLKDAVGLVNGDPKWQSAQMIPAVGKIAWSRFSTAGREKRLNAKRKEIFARVKEGVEKGKLNRREIHTLRREYNKVLRDNPQIDRKPIKSSSISRAIKSKRKALRETKKRPKSASISKGSPISLAFSTLPTLEGKAGDSFGTPTGEYGVTKVARDSVGPEYKEDKDVAKAYLTQLDERLSQELEGYESADSVTKAGILDAAYNVGISDMLKWKEFKAAVKSRDSEGALLATLDTANVNGKSVRGLARRRALSYNRVAKKPITKVQQSHTGKITYFTGKEVLYSYTPTGGKHSKSTVGQMEV